MTVALEIEKIVCHQCYAVLDVGDNFCRHCGAAMRALAANSRVPDRAEPDRSHSPAKWSEGHWAVLVALLLLLGPLAVPMLWRSRGLPTVWKIILTIFVLAVTAVMIGLLWHVFYKSLEPLRQLQELQRHSP